MVRSDLKALIERITRDMVRHFPKAVVLFGSAARYLKGQQAQAPEDIDLLYVGTLAPIGKKAYGIPIDLFFFETQEIVAIARSLRYLPKAAARAKMFLKDNWKGYVRADIAACLLLGDRYPEYGFLQMETEEAYRDYAVHQVLHGADWWHALQQYAREHRGVRGLGIDKTLGQDRFSAPCR